MTPVSASGPHAPHRASTERLILLASLFFVLFCNRPLWSALLAGRAWSNGSTWVFAGAMFAILTAMHSILLGLALTRRTAKPLLALLFVVTASATYYMNRYTVFFDTSMLRNVLHTDVREASELLSVDWLAYLALCGVLPAAILWRLPIRHRSWPRAFAVRVGFMLGAVAVFVAGAALVFQDLSTLLRNQREVRYLITPANFLVSAVRVLVADTGNVHAAAREAVGRDARLGARWPVRGKPVLFVVVVGETARAANWGLNGYARQTTPQLAQAGDVLNFAHVTSCGTNTEASVPCMFSPFGRHDYDEAAIRRHESLLHVLTHAGFKTVWRDNQSGCKGVCDGLELQRPEDKHDPAFCDSERCLDEILLQGLEGEIGKQNGNMMLVLHQLGNHGPAYFRRYPVAFRQFTPTCETSELGKCTREEVVNSYDNALLYTDHFLHQTIRTLKAQTSHDVAMLYVSDHGESLGEKGLYLHGIPYAIAPREQTEVPMVMWASDAFVSRFGLNRDCLEKQAAQPLTHDYLFHSILGMLDVRTSAYDRAYDFTASCRDSANADRSAGPNRNG